MVDVIVAGGGPVGVLLACELRLHGVDVVVLEKEPEPSPHSRAFRLQPRTMELLDYRGLAERFRQGRTQWPKAHFAGLRPLLDLGALPGEHPYSLLIPQADTERLLAGRAAELGTDLRRGHRLTGLAEAADSVVAEVTGPDGPYTLTASFLVGCDGGRSTVRRLAGFDFPGTAASVTALLGDVLLDDPEQLPTGVPGTLRTPSGLLMAVALEDPVVRVLTTEFTAPRGDTSAPVTEDELRAAVERVTGHTVDIKESRWLSRFSDATRLVTEYRRGRVLLAGDAAHIHFPIGAQGLNLGLQEAVNLGWKLAATVRGAAPSGLLDTYHRERHPVARRVLRETSAQLALMNPDPRTDPLREIVGELLALPAANLHLAALVSGTDVICGAQDGAHPWVGRPAPALALMSADGRTRIAELLHEGRAVLVDLAGDLSSPAYAAELRDRGVDVVRAEAVGGAGVAGLLVRPDGHVAWAGPVGDPLLRQALETWFAPAPDATTRSRFEDRAVTDDKKGTIMAAFTLDDARRVMKASAGEDGTTAVEGDVRDASFSDLGYDSLALLEAASLIEREYGVSLPDEGLAELGTLGRLVEFVNERLAPKV
ncbi:FAD-dependent monooxygenase [Streptomyces viridochromogenes]|uniref:FAD-dependent monooxygenase n=1 Tax=Streptomyces viridochromogenes TaxID=1938 RepID=UPI00065C71E6|nr:FAD-dependent monooxygenase [Streptomyces viridochromogenes]